MSPGGPPFDEGLLNRSAQRTQTLAALPKDSETPSSFASFAVGVGVPMLCRIKYFRWLALCCAALATTPIHAQGVVAPVSDAAPATEVAVDTDSIPPPLTHYRGREIAQTMHYLGAPWLIRESRQREEDCETMLRALQLRPGMHVCDMGCGNGFYTLQMAAAVQPEGLVYAVDIQAEMLRLMQARAAEARIENVRPILGTLVNPRLPDNSLDLILLVDVYHEFSHPEHMLDAMRRALKPEGVAVLVEFREEDPEVPIKPLHKMSKRQILKEWPPNGFRLVRQFDDLPWQHMMFFQRDDLPSAIDSGQRPSGRLPGED
jgi:SAM-dependent methyltransferase